MHNSTHAVMACPFVRRYVCHIVVMIASNRFKWTHVVAHEMELTF